MTGGVQFIQVQSGSDNNQDNTEPPETIIDKLLKVQEIYTQVIFIWLYLTQIPACTIIEYKQTNSMQMQSRRVET
jgi:hypothetical protein